MAPIRTKNQQWQQFSFRYWAICGVYHIGQNMDMLSG